MSSNLPKTHGEKIRQWYLDNPDRHPWRKHSKFKSVPCEKVKEFLKTLNIRFIAEYQPNVGGRNFSIDIAMPDKLIAIEINGNQHYEKEGRLKPYYQIRQELLEKEGWTVYQVHYSCCFNLEKWRTFFTEIESSQTKVDFDYFHYTPIKKSERKKYCKCGKEICRYRSIHCRSCAATFSSKRKVERPTKEKLIELIKSTPMIKLGIQFGVSDMAVRKWCKRYGIDYKSISPFSHLVLR